MHKNIIIIITTTTITTVAVAAATAVATAAARAAATALAKVGYLHAAVIRSDKRQRCCLPDSVTASLTASDG
ncbi:hypothetical protein PoB_003204300 [Plakobranchus ocellatus]|uniref:Secreted protein n=1 Tax=Plakobranchus ocellatus TaxID=259542 RepID=A0AAV4AFJ0_9GAST|nr:hypothetical protein PoB_003204300 [Plakobranchus ocellatus]